MPSRLVVVKVGTGSLATSEGKLDEEEMSRLVKQTADAIKRGEKIVLVTSGAVAAGSKLPRVRWWARALGRGGAKRGTWGKVCGGRPRPVPHAGRRAPALPWAAKFGRPGPPDGHRGRRRRPSWTGSAPLPFARPPHSPLNPEPSAGVQ